MNRYILACIRDLNESTTKAAPDRAAEAASHFPVPDNTPSED